MCICAQVCWCACQCWIPWMYRSWAACWGYRNQTRVLCNNRCAPNHWAISPVFFINILGVRVLISGHGETPWMLWSWDSRKSYLQRRGHWITRGLPTLRRHMLHGAAAVLLVTTCLTLRRRKAPWLISGLSSSEDIYCPRVKTVCFFFKVFIVKVGLCSRWSVSQTASGYL